MANITQSLCSICKNNDICKYKEEYEEIFSKIENPKNSLFEHRLTCNKFQDVRPPVIETFATACTVRG